MDAQLLQGDVQAHVAHDGGHQRVVAQAALLLEVIGADAHHLVAVDEGAALVHGHQAVRVAIKGQADIRTQLPHQLTQALGMGGAAVLVDVGAVGLMIIHRHRGAQLLQHGGGHLIAGALGAVYHNVQPVKAGAGGFLGKVDVAALGVALTHRAAHLSADGQVLVLGQAVADDVLNAVLHRIRQLIAVAVKELDAVVLHSVVAGGNHRARIRLVIPGQIGDGRGRQHLHQHGLRAHGADARHQGGLQHFTADAGITPHQNGGPVHVACQHIGAGLAQFEGQLAGQVLIRYSTHAVGAKESCH